jgi:hypothetical protein
MPPTDDPTDPVDDPPRGRRRVSGAQLLDAMEALPGRVATALRGGSDDGDDDAGGGPLPPQVTFEPEPEPEPDEPDDTPVEPATLPDVDGIVSRRRGGFPRRRR